MGFTVGHNKEVVLNLAKTLKNKILLYLFKLVKKNYLEQSLGLNRRRFTMLECMSYLYL